MTDDNTKLNISTYDQIAEEYAAEAETRISHIERKNFLDLIQPPGKLLDVGCGSGKDGAYFQSLGFDVTGIDLSPELLKQAKKYHPELKTKLMDMRKLDFADKTFDAIWAHAALLHLERKDLLPTVKEFYRVMKENGICYILVKEGQGDELKVENKSHGQKRYFSYFTLKEIEETLISAKFSIAKSYIFNGKERQGRDHNWIVVYAKK